MHFLVLETEKFNIKFLHLERIFLLCRPTAAGAKMRGDALMHGIGLNFVFITGARVLTRTVLTKHFSLGLLLKLLPSALSFQYTLGAIQTTAASFG